MHKNISPILPPNRSVVTSINKAGVITDRLSRRPTGIVRVKSIDENGNILSEQVNNLVLNEGIALLALLMTNPTAGLAINTLSLGNNGLIFGDDTSTIPAPEPTNTGLVNKFFSTGVSSFVITTSAPIPDTGGATNTIITYTFNVAANQANASGVGVYNNLITELGLGTADGSYLFARTILIATKTPVIILNITWEITL